MKAIVIAVVIVVLITKGLLSIIDTENMNGTPEMENHFAQLEKSKDN